MIDKTYYSTMLKKGRLIPFVIGDRFVCFITFYICNKGEENKYLRDNMWSVEEDNLDGNCCYLDQLWADKNKNNTKIAIEIWQRFRKYIKQNFPNVRYFHWRRWKNNKGYIYKKKEE